MAIYRQLHTTFWKDRRVGEWNKEQKLFFLYLLSNDHTTQCGVYEFNKRYAKFELDVSSKEIDELIDFLVSEGRIVFNEKTEELMIINWLKYNSSRSPKVAAVIDKELREIKTLEFEEEVIRKCKEYGYPIKTEKPKENTISIGYRYSIDTISQPTPASTPTPSPTPASATTAEIEKPLAVVNAYELYQEVFGVLNSINTQDIGEWIKDIGEDLVCEAFRRAALEQKGYAYAKGIMKQWESRNIKTMEDVFADDVRHQNQINYKKQKPVRKEVLPDWASDEYDYKKVEAAKRKEREIHGKLPEISLDDPLPL